MPILTLGESYPIMQAVDELARTGDETMFPTMKMLRNVYVKAVLDRYDGSTNAVASALNVSTRWVQYWKRATGYKPPSETQNAQEQSQS